MASNGGNGTYDKFEKSVKEIRLLSSANALLSWDHEVNMPKKGGEWRAEQMALLAGLIHDRMVSDEMGEMLEHLSGPAKSGGLAPERATNVREVARSFEREKKLPAELVKETARTQTLAQEAWVEARKASDFAHFAPMLDKMVDLKKQAAAYLGWDKQKGEIYDALLEDFEPGTLTRELTPVFDGLRSETVALVKAIQATGSRPDLDLSPERGLARGGGQPQQPARVFPTDKQKEFAQAVARDMGFDFEAGRLDISAHPFCSGMSVKDVRLTTRYNEKDATMALFGVIHETGHGLYEQGYDPAHAGTPMAEAVSSGIHESQSRLWENQVARSRPFWKHYYPKLQATFGESLGDVAFDRFYFAINEVTPSFIRVEADEVTYNLHILLRFELERELLAGRVSVSDLPGLWNKKMQEYLGIAPPNDAKGVLQDIHWSLGLFGYFPTYTLGNLYAAQFFAKAKEDIADLEGNISRGELTPLREWLRDKIHRHGMRYRATELCRVVTGKALDSSFFTRYVKAKFGEIYGVK
jgi:carboxypeptidase Taq